MGAWKRPITYEEYKKIDEVLRKGFLNHRPNPRIAAALLTEANTGCRVGDVCQLTLDNFVRSGSEIRLVMTQQKRKKPRSIPVTQAFYDFIFNYAYENKIERTARLFPITTRMIQYMLKEACDYLGFEDKELISTHSYRKMYGTSIYNQSEYDLYLTMIALNHSSIETTKRYLGLESKRLHEAVQNTVFL